MKKAKEKGLPVEDGWSVRLGTGNKKVWISPTGKLCTSIPEAMAVAGVLPHNKKLVNTRYLTKEEIMQETKKAQKAGLPNTWKLCETTQKRQKIWIN